MDTVILAGGYAKRMQPTTKEAPKHLLPLVGRPMLSYVLDSLRNVYSNNPGQCYISVNRKYERDFTNFANDFSRGLQTKLLVEDTKEEGKKLGSIGALKEIKNHLMVPFGERALVLGGDNISSIDLRRFIDYSSKYPESTTIALYDIKDRQKAGLYGVTQLDSEDIDNEGGRIAFFEEKPANPNSTLISTAVYNFSKNDLDGIDDYIKEGNNPDTLGSYIKWLISRRYVRGFVFNGFWYDIGSHESFDEANLFFRELNPNLLVGER